MTNKICSYNDKNGYHLNSEPHPFWNGKLLPDIKPPKNKRIRCPQCNRKMWAAIRTCHDGCCIFYCVPVHKIKGWKKDKKKKINRKKKYYK